MTEPSIDRLLAKAVDSENWFAATFHSGWSMKLQPDSMSAYEQLDASHAKLDSDTAKLLPIVVTQALALPPPDGKLEIPDTGAPVSPAEDAPDPAASPKL